MGLTFGWCKTEVRESIWIDDPALEGVSEAAREAWEEDGDASHLRPFVKVGKPTVIEFRSLTSDETRKVMAMLTAADVENEGGARAALLCFRIGCNFPGMRFVTDVEGATHDMIVKEHGCRMIAAEACAAFDKAYPSMAQFYGLKIFAASFATDAEKKASSQPSTARKSSNGTGRRAKAAKTAPKESTPECDSGGAAQTSEASTS